MTDCMIASNWSKSDRDDRWIQRACARYSASVVPVRASCSWMRSKRVLLAHGAILMQLRV